MTVFTAVARGSLPTTGTSGVSTLDITFGAGFGQPVAVKIVVGGVTDGTEHASSGMSFGVTDGTSQFVHSIGLENQQTSGRENGWSRYSTVGMIAMSNRAGGTNGLFSFDSWITNGIRLLIDAVPTISFKYTAWAVNGDGVQAHVGVSGAINPGNSVVITAPGFQPDAMCFIGQGLYSATPAWGTTAETSLGFATRNPGELTALNCFGTWWNVDNLLTTEVEALVSGSLACCMGSLFTGSKPTYLGRGYVSTFSATGFTLANYDQNNTILGFGYLALKLPGVRVWCGTITVPGTIAVTQDYDEPGGEVQTVFAVPNMRVDKDIIGTDDSASSIGYGIAAGRGTVAFGCVNLREEDANANAPFSAGVLSEAKFGHVLTGNGGDAVIADSVARTRGGFSITFSAVWADQVYWPVMTIGYGRSLVPKRRSSMRDLLVR